MRTVITSYEHLLEVLEKEVAAAEKRARKRCLQKWQLEELARAVYQHRAGAARATGGYVPNSYTYTAYMTKLEVAWWHRRGVLYVYADASRPRAPHVPYGAGPNTNIWPGASWDTMWKTVPDRAERLASLLDARLRRVLQAKGLTAPSGDSRFFIVKHIRSLRCRDNVDVAVVVATLGIIEDIRAQYLDLHHSAYLCLPNKAVWLRSPNGKLTAKDVAVALKVSEQVAHRLLKGSITSEELQAERVANALQGVG